MDEQLKKIVYKCLDDYSHVKGIYDRIYDYCISGESDARKNYKNNKDRSNLKVKANFIKKFIKEEVSYLLSNPPTFTSKSDNESVIGFIETKTAHWSKKHNKELFRDILTYGFAFELYYYEKVVINGVEEYLFKARNISPRDGYALEDENGNVVLFIRFYKKKFDDNRYMDIYTDNYIYHYKGDDEEISPPTINRWGRVPVTVADISHYRQEDTLFNDIRELQDAFETNLSDIVNEISDYRLAYFLALGVSLDIGTIDEMKAKGIINATDKDAVFKFLTKDINDTFVQNTLKTLEKQIYNLSNHIDTNEKLQSNTSGEALRNRLIGLEQRVKDGESAMQDAISNRLDFMFSLFNKIEKSLYDYRDVGIKFTLNIPKNDLTTAQTLSQLPEGIVSKETGRTLLSFISNTVAEGKKIEKEKSDDLGAMTINSFGDPNGEE